MRLQQIWFEIAQPDVHAFADVTRDWQDIQVDPDRAAEGPYGTPVARGFYVLSLVTFPTDSLLDLDWSASGLNQRPGRALTGPPRRLVAPAPGTRRAPARRRRLTRWPVPGPPAGA
ncbi:MaoC/PaaZ C-terminal domain-containing protein [Streptomyces sp. NPDC058657]|uniref:MaoC/PaaZ C-terminal domain-containing protein n=1 Tax=unclassified Streptomyces TaxID=2593676 RepID=UPI00364743EB